jgi:hypothetical protein
MNSENAKKIDAYIKGYESTCKLNYPERVRIQDKMTEIPVYRLPLNLLYYNVANGRFAKEYLNLKKQLGRELNSEDPNDVKEIEKMLREQSIPKTNWLKNNLKEVGQEEPGIITHHGYVINGNRRMSVLSSLAKEDSKFGYMNVGRLPENVSEPDIYKIELGKQMARDQKLDYGPINELLKIEHGIKSGLTIEQIANTIGFSKEEIEEKIERLELIKEYLDFVNDPENFELAESINEHFIDLQNSIFSKKKQRKQQFTTLELLDIKEIAFSAINAGIPHLNLRKIPKMVNNPKIKPHFMSAKTFAGKDPKKTLEIFSACETRLKAEEEKDKPGVLLDAILGNFESLDINHPQLKTNDYKTIIKKIISYADELKKLI